MSKISKVLSEEIAIKLLKKNKELVEKKQKKIH